MKEVRRKIPSTYISYNIIHNVFFLRTNILFFVRTYTLNLVQILSSIDFSDIPEIYIPAPKHFKLVEEEKKLMVTDKRSARRTITVHKRVQDEELNNPTDFGGDIDWDTELQAFGVLPYPDYYTLPFHSVPGGWLSKRAAMKNRIAMQAIYREAHPKSCMGVREILSGYVPSDAKRVVDLGSGDGDGPAITARMLPNAKVLAIEASPFMIICGRRQNRDAVNLEFRHALAEETFLPSNCCDAVTITLVFHECNDDAKHNILKEAYRILKPGGTIVFADTPQDDLFTYRGFYEPWKHQWLNFDCEQSLKMVGFTNIIDQGILGGDGRVRSIQEHKEKGNSSEESTDNRLFVFTAMKDIKASL